MDAESSLAERALTFLENLYKQGGTGAVVAVVIAAIASLAVAGAVLIKVLAALTELLEAYKNSGLPWLVNRAQRLQVRRRSQFCAVLNADLAVLAKSENWNDQHFADLEAEVEAEGLYYPTVLHQLFRRPQRGLRRVNSLMRAIEASTEKVLLLVGEPGSGKSVALRHLGHRLAKRGIDSRAPDAKVPLYVNLRELRIGIGEPVTADAIKGFVLDNIRRGDADTAAYVREKWDDYRQRGIWFFLFDSFDEIPAVLHAPTAGREVRIYAEAIRQFLEGMSACRGILASREYKGPSALPWQKIRILPLSERRRAELIENTFLTPDQKRIVKEHLALSRSTLGHSPMFLTLMCRFIREEGHPPRNDHSLLGGHLARLASRDADYIFRKYQLSSDQLLRGAVEVAAMLARHPGLSLAPTVDEIVAAFDAEMEANRLKELLSALVEAKLARTDIQEARAGDRRFAFAHRRYQETLFVQYLAAHPAAVSPRELLTDSRWREYAVTLLQTQEGPAFTGLVMDATLLLRNSTSKQVPAVVEIAVGQCYFAWEHDSAAPLLALLQEGLGARLGEVDDSLRIEVGRVLGERWNSGDALDRMMVLRLGGILPSEQLVDYVEQAVTSWSRRLQDAAFEKVRFLSEVPEGLAKWVRGRLAADYLGSRRASEVVRIEALASRLPAPLGARHVIRRCRALRAWTMVLAQPVYLYLKFAFRVTAMAFGELKAPANLMSRELMIRHFALLSSIMLLVLAGVMMVFTAQDARWVVRGLGTAFGLLVLGAGLWLGLTFAFRSTGERMTPRLVAASVRRTLSIRGLKEVLLPAVKIALPLAVLFLGMTFLRKAGGPNAVGIGGVSLLFVAAAWVGRDALKKRMWEAQIARLALTLQPARIVLSATSLAQLEIWIEADGSPVIRDSALVRSLSALAFAVRDGRLDGHQSQLAGLLGSEDDVARFSGVIELALDRLSLVEDEQVSSKDR